MYGAAQTTAQATRILSFMRERPQFLYLSVDAFRKLTPLQKQEYVVVLKNHLDVPIRDDTAGHPQRSPNGDAPEKSEIALSS